ncbi:hypothetical protein SGCOL_005875 [Colletotrichum sp. CLE4]
MASPSPEETAATRLGEDGAILLDHQWIYSPGRRLHLQQHKPLPPYGSHLYPIPQTLSSQDMMLSNDEKNYSLRRIVFDPRNAPKTHSMNNQNDPSSLIEVEIVRMIGGSPGAEYQPGPQKILCKVVVSPSTLPNKQEHDIPFEGQLLFLKIFDAFFWHKATDITKRAIKLTIQADGAFSDEFGAYDHLYKKKLTGFPNVAPQFYGGWTTAVKTLHPSFANQTRNVAVLATEFIEGTCLDQLFTVAGPNAEVVNLYGDAKPPGAFTTNRDDRMKIIKQLMDGTISQEHIGLDHCEVYPENVIISMRNKGESLEEPWAVLVGYGRALVDHVRTRPAKMWEHFPLKHHPILRCGWPRWKFFAGWIPAAWASPPGKADDVPLLNQWVVLTFGRLDVNEIYTIFPTMPTSPQPEGLSTSPEPERQSVSAVPQGQP